MVSQSRFAELMYQAIDGFSSMHHPPKGESVLPGSAFLFGALKLIKQGPDRRLRDRLL
jgi:hypothetical protein